MPSPNLMNHKMQTRRTLMLTSLGGLGNRMVRASPVAPPALTALWEARAAEFLVAERVAHAATVFYDDISSVGVTKEALVSFKQIETIARFDERYAALSAQMARDGADARFFVGVNA